MKSIVIYSSLTGNTKQVAEAITSVLPAGTPCVSMKEVPSDLSSYDLVFAGFWVDKGDPKVIEMMYKMFPKGHSHGQSADRDARHKQAAVHPNEDDFKSAQDFAQHILAKLD